MTHGLKLKSEKLVSNFGFSISTGTATQRLWELQARFTRAVAELEFLGVARPVKRSKVEYMQRTAFPLDRLLGVDD